MIKKIELLVHAGAPSGRKDDDRYKAQAEAYFAFGESVTKLRLSSFNTGYGDGLELHHPNQAETTAVTNKPAVFLDDTQLAWTALDSQLATSSFLIQDEHNTKTPAPHTSGEDQYPQDVTPETNIRLDPRVSLQRSTCEASSSGHCSGKRKLDSSNAAPAEEQQIRADLGKCQLKTHIAALDTEMAAEKEPSTPSSYLRSPDLDRPWKRAKVDDQAEGNHDLDQPVVVPSVTIPEGRNARPETLAKQPFQTAEYGIRDSISRSQGSNGAQTTSELPTSYSLSRISSDSSRARPNVSQRSTSDPGPNLGSLSPNALRAVLAAQEPLHEENAFALGQPNGETKSRNPKYPHANGQASAGPAGLGPQKGKPTNGPNATPAAPSPHHEQHTRSQRHESKGICENICPQGVLHLPGQNATALNGLSTSINPPQPATSVDKFTTHITSAFRFLAESLDITKTYKPVFLSRSIRPLERGYWLIDCPENSSHWSLEQQIQFWQNLEKYINNGSAGWGVWCTRNDGDSESLVGKERVSLGTVKVFCWGEVVPHLYLMLYVASNSKVRKLGLRWVDAEGEVVVQMRGA